MVVAARPIKTFPLRGTIEQGAIEALLRQDQEP